MVKIHCDRCGKEIVEKHYYTITVGKAELNPKCEYSISDCANAISAYNHEQEKSLYEKLNSQVMYCEECKNDIEEVINSNGSVIHMSEVMYKDLLKYKYMYEELCK